MTASSAEPRPSPRSARGRLSPCVVAALGLSLAVVASARAQTPLEPADGEWLTPAPVAAEAPSGPIRLFPDPGAEGQEAPPEDAPREVRDGILAIDSLDAVSAEAAGLLDPGAGGLPLDMWQGSERAVIAQALRALPVTSGAPARNALARRLLLTAAPPPEAGAGAETADLLELRLDRLLALGATAQVRDLVAAVSPDARPGAQAEPLRRAEANAWLIDNRTDEACAIVEDGLSRFDPVWWQKAATFCQLAKGNIQAANLQLSMLREQGVDDAAFLWAAEQLAGLRVLSLHGLSDPSPLTIAMIRATGRPYPAGTLVDPEPWLARAVALGDRTDMDLRLQAAEGAYLAGAFSREALTALYEQVDFPQDAFAQPLSEVVSEPGVRTNALLWQMAAGQTVPAAKVEVIAAALEVAADRGRPLLGAHLYAPQIAALPTATEFLWFAGPAARALYAAGDAEGGRAWFRLAAEAAPTSATAALAADAVWPLDRIAFETASDRWPARRLDAWRRGATEAAEDADGADAADRPARLEARLLSLFQATGDRVRAADWAPLFGRPSHDGAVPAAPAWHAITDATDNLRLGETVLLGLLILNDAAPGAESDAALYRVVESLRLVGLEDTARRIALESAVAAGL